MFIVSFNEKTGCEENDNEVIVMYSADSKFLQKLDIHGFAKQFKTETNIVRLLKFVTTQPLQDFNLEYKVLQITDTEIQPMSALNRIQECKYKINARNFLMEIGFSANKSRGILYIGYHTDSFFTTIFRNVIPDGLNLTMYRVMEIPKAGLKIDSIPHVTDVLIRRWSLLDTIGAEYFPDICTGLKHTKLSKFSFVIEIHVKPACFLKKPDRGDNFKVFQFIYLI